MARIFTTADGKIIMKSGKLVTQNPWAIFGTPVAWYDASDVSTITASGNSLISWADKSGRGGSAVAAGESARPLTGITTQNGLNTISFDGIDDGLVAPGCLSAPEASIYLIMKSTANITAAMLGMGTIQTYANYGLTFYVINWGGNPRLHMVWSQDINADYSVDTFELLTLVSRPVELRGYIRDLAIVDNRGFPQQELTPGAPITIGYQNEPAAFPNGFFKGEVAELICFDVAHTTEQVAALRAELSEKWAIVTPPVA